MKRILSLLLAFTLVFAFSAASHAEGSSPLTEEEIKAMIGDGTLNLDLIDPNDLYTKTTAVTIGGSSISPAMLNYSYVTQYYTFLRSYGSYAAYFGLDTSLGVNALSAQQCAIAESGTWRDYFLSSAIESLMTNMALCAYAEENGIVLTEEEQAAALEGMDTIEATAVENGFESADDFLAASYGPGASVELLRQFSLDYALATKAYSEIYNGISVTDDEVRAAHPTIAVRHILIKAVPEEDGTYTDDAKTLAKERAEEILAEWLAGEATEESFAALAEQYSEDPGSNTNGGLYDSVEQGQMVKEFDAFCFEEGRTPGDSGIVYGESGTYAGYHVMYFVGEGDLEAGREELKMTAMSSKLDEMNGSYEVFYGPYISFAGII